MRPVDLLNRPPEMFAPGERQTMARAFQRAWLAIAPGIGNDPKVVQSTRLRLAEVVIEKAKDHDTVESLANAAIYAALRQALRK